jgi:YVTN family beta-propeller protein
MSRLYYLRISLALGSLLCIVSSGPSPGAAQNPGEPAGPRVYVGNWGSGTVSVIDPSQGSQVVATDENPGLRTVRRTL